MADTPWIIGIDLCRDYSQLSWYDMEKNEMEYLSVKGDPLVPTALCRLRPDDGQPREGGPVSGGVYLFGKAALDAQERGTVIRPLTGEGDASERKQNIIIFLRSLLCEVVPDGDDRPVMLTVTSPEEEQRELILSAAREIVGEQGDASFQSRLLSYEYYALSQKIDLWSRGVGLFEYDRRGLRYTYLDISPNHRPSVVQAERTDLKEVLSGASLEFSDNAVRDRLFSNAIDRVSDGRVISTYYLTGEGFENIGEGSGWMSRSLEKLCGSHRHVFVGQNLFASGACYGSLYRILPGSRPEFVIADTELTIYSIYLSVQMGGRDGILPVLAEQQNWREAHGEAQFILDNTDILPLRVQNILSGDTATYRLRLPNLPSRPNKTLRLKIEASCIRPSVVRLRVSDTGFGQLYPASGWNWEKDLPLTQDPETITGLSPEPDSPALGNAGRGRLIAASPGGQPGLEIRHSGRYVYSTDELSWFVANNIYMVPDHFFDEDLFHWLELKLGSTRLSDTLRRDLSRNMPQTDMMRTMLSALGFLSATEISTVCSSFDKLGKKSPLEKARIKADSLCSYGNHMEALQLYHHATWLIEHGTADPAGRSTIRDFDRFAGETWHNMAVCLMNLHDVDGAADAMFRAWEAVHDTNYITEYICILYMGGREHEIRRVTAREDISDEMIEQAVALCRSASRAYSESERWLGLKAGLTRKSAGGGQVYTDFVNGYIRTQCRRYGMSGNGRNGEFYEERRENTVQ